MPKPCETHTFALRGKCLGTDGTCYGPYYTSMDKADLKHRKPVEELEECEWQAEAERFLREWQAKKWR